MLSKILSTLLFTCLAAHAQTPARMEPIRLCEVVLHLETYDGKNVAIVGRYSFRRTGRTLSEASCEDSPNSLAIAFDSKSGPKPPEHLEIDSTAVARLLKLIQQQTSLAKFRFGSADYDRWAVVYGRVEKGLAGAPPRILCVGDSEVVFLVDRY